MMHRPGSWGAVRGEPFDGSHSGRRDLDAGDAGQHRQGPASHRDTDHGGCAPCAADRRRGRRVRRSHRAGARARTASRRDSGDDEDEEIRFIDVRIPRGNEQPSESCERARERPTQRRNPVGANTGGAAEEFKVQKGLSLEDVRAQIAITTVDSPKGNIDGDTHAYTIYANDQLLDAKAWNDVIIAYRNGGPLQIGRAHV